MDFSPPHLFGGYAKTPEEAYVIGQKPVDMETVLLIPGVGAEDAAEDNEAAIEILTL